VQSLRTEQHNKKKERDWTEKMRNDGYRDLCSFFRHKPTLLESGDDAQDSDQEELDKISSPFASGSFISDVTEDSADEDNDKELYPISMEPIAEREEENLGEIPEVPDAGPGPGAQWVPSRPPPTPPPGPDHVDQRIKDIENILHPKRKTGYGHIDSDLNYTLRTRLEMMLHFLRIYQINGYEGWIASSEQAARIGGRKAKWTARRLREWTHAFVRDTTNLPDHEYGKWNSSVLEDEDLAQEICLHLQSKGPYVCAMDIVQFLETPEMKERLNLKKPILERTARRWMNRMGYRWKKEPKGQYKDGHECEDVVAY